MSLSGGGQWGYLNDLENKSVTKECNGFAGFGNIGSVQRQSPQPHSMPQPSGLPWSIQDMNWGTAAPQGAPVEFTAGSVDVYSRNRKPNVLHCKRKSDFHRNIPSKQLITEEKMAAYFDGMHISGDYTTHTSDEEGQGSSGLDEASCAERLRAANRIVLSQEVIRMRTEPILPHSIMERLEKPCTSLVLWKPPKRLTNSPEDGKDPNNNPDDDYPDEEASGSCNGSTQRKSVLVPGPSCMDMEM